MKKYVYNDEGRTALDCFRFQHVMFLHAHTEQKTPENQESLVQFGFKLVKSDETDLTKRDQTLVLGPLHKKTKLCHFM